MRDDAAYETHTHDFLLSLLRICDRGLCSHHFATGRFPAALVLKNEVTLRTDPSKGLACVWLYYDAPIRRFDDFFIQARQLLPLSWAMQFDGTMRPKSRRQLTQWRCRAQSLPVVFLHVTIMYGRMQPQETRPKCWYLVLCTLVCTPKFPLYIDTYY